MIRYLCFIIISDHSLKSANLVEVVGLESKNAILVALGVQASFVAVRLAYLGPVVDEDREAFRAAFESLGA